MSEQENIRILRASVNALNAGDLDRWSSFQADDYMADNSAAPGSLNKEQARALQQGFLTAFPDLHIDVTRTIAQGDYVVVHWTTTGTQRGPCARLLETLSRPPAKKERYSAAAQLKSRMARSPGSGRSGIRPRS